MDQNLKTIVTKMTRELEAWLDQPSASGQKIAHLRKELAGLKAELGAGVLAETLKSLEKADAGAKRLRQREAADAIAELCKPLGVVLEAKEPPKRKPRTKKAKASSGTASKDEEEASPKVQGVSSEGQ